MRAPVFLHAFLASMAIGAATAQLSTLPSCAQTCVANMLNQATTFGCTSTSDTACLCASSAFTSGSKDCTSQGCGADQLALVNTYLTNMCGATASSSSVAAASPAAPTTSASAVPGVTSAAAVVPGVTTTTAAAAAAATTTSLHGAATVPGVAATTTTTATALAGAATTTAGVVGIGSNSMTTSVRPSASASHTSSSTDAAIIPVATSSSGSNSDKDSSDAKKTTGLSSAAKAGIGVGIGAVAVAMIIIAGVFVLKKNSGASEYHSDKMNSGPMASAGSQFGFSTTHQRLSDSGAELKATRYEDMVPRTAPRNMV